MTQFIVPRFKEQKAKIVGPLTFEQFIYIGTAGVISFILYYTVGTHSFALFFMGAAIAFSVGAGLAFGRINGRPIPVMLKNLVFFTLGPKMYLWKRKVGPPPRMAKEKPIAKKVEETRRAPVVGTTKKSKLKDLFVEIETRNK